MRSAVLLTSLALAVVAAACSSSDANDSSGATPAKHTKTTAGHPGADGGSSGDDTSGDDPTTTVHGGSTQIEMQGGTASAGAPANGGSDQGKTGSEQQGGTDQGAAGATQGAAGQAQGGAGHPAGPVSLSKSDVSILFPLPKNADEYAAWPSPTTVGAQGQLLSPTAYQKVLTALVEDNDFGMKKDLNEQMAPSLTPDSYSTLRLVALRVDPCFAPLDINTTGCQPLIRGIFQPVAIGPSGNYEAGDGGVHVFWKLTSDDLLQFMYDYIAARDANGGNPGDGPLGVHPILASQGLSGAFGTSLMNAFLGYVGTGVIGRVTIFTKVNTDQGDTKGEEIDTATGSGAQPDGSNDPFLDWRFGVIDGKGNAQHVINTGDQAGFQGFRTGLEAHPSTVCTTTSSGGYDNSTTTTCVTTTPPQTESLVVGVGINGADSNASHDYDVALRTENPTQVGHTPDNIDCASCHIAQAVRARHEAAGMTPTGNANLYVSDTGRNLEHAGFAGPSMINIHAFSYVGPNFAVNQRTANESGMIADQMQSQINIH